jgi:hypothetical protein
MSAKKFKEIDVNIEKLENGDLSSQELYNHKMVNWSGPSSPDREKSYYTDYIAKQLLKRQDLLKLDIESRRADYFEPSHNGLTEEFNDSSVEKIFAKSLFGHTVENLGKILDYEVPLSERDGESSNPKRYGDIDLVSFNNKTNILYLIELKRPDKENKYETLLRAGLEIANYGNLANYSKLREYFKKVLNHRYKNHSLSNHINNNFSVRYAVLYATNPTAGLPQELRAENRGRYPNLFKLLYELNIGIFTIDHQYPTNIHNNPWK